jgi:hypothetical protein
MILSTHGVIASQIQSFVGLLDTYPNAAAAYSLRKLRTAYTGNAIRVRRTDLTESDIGFTSSGELDTTALLSFTGTGALDNGFITTWYDQSGNSLNATQTTALNQPKIVSSGSVILANGKATLEFFLSQNLRNSTLSLTQPFTAFYAGVADNSESTVYDGRTARSFMRDRGGAARIFSGSNLSVSGSVIFKTIYGLHNSTLSEVLVNNLTKAVGNAGVNNLSDVFIGGDAFALFDGKMSEVILYDSNESSNQIGITNNINSFYTIF